MVDFIDIVCSSASNPCIEFYRHYDAQYCQEFKPFVLVYLVYDCPFDIALYI